MNRMHSIFLFVILAATDLCTAAGGGPPFPNRIVIRAEHSSWGFASTNLTLTLSNGVYAAGTYGVPPPLISNLMAAARRPWPKPAKGTWPRFGIDPANLGLNAAWVKTNYERLLQGYSGNLEKGVFPNASARQRTWLTNALADVQLLGQALRDYFQAFWTDDSPTLELRFEHDDGRTVEQLFRLNTRAKHSFMLPWQIDDGTKEFTSGNADISRAVVQLLPPGFMHRDRLSGDLFGIVLRHFPSVAKVRNFLTASTLEETLGDQADRLLQGGELQNCRTRAGSHNRFPDTFTATFHRANWPQRLTMRISTQIERGVATNLKAILGSAEARVAPLLEQEWLVSRLKGFGDVAVEVNLDGSRHYQLLRGPMDKVGLAAFYDRIQPSLRRSLRFMLREDDPRTSQWAIFEDGRILLYGFTGNGVLDWKPDDLGAPGSERRLGILFTNYVGVFVGPEGSITEVVEPQTK